MKAAPLIIIICLLLVVIVSTVIFKYDWANNNNPDYSITLVLNSDYDFFKKGNLVCFINNPTDNIVFSGGDTIGQVDSTYTLNKRTHVKLKIRGKYEIPDSSIFWGMPCKNGPCISVEFSPNKKKMIKPNAFIDNQHQIHLGNLLIRL